MIFTSYWSNLDNVVKMVGKDKVIGISRWSKFWNGKVCSKLFPSEDLLKGYKNGSISKKEYEKIYKKYLMSLNVENFVKVFDGCCLMCYEKSGDFCHRNFVRDWLKYNGYESKEISRFGLID